MKIINKDIKEINSSNSLNSNFINSYHDKLNLNCPSLKKNFYLDSFNYFPITHDFFCFKEIFSWGDISKYNNFFTKDFAINFEKNFKKFKTISDTFVLGSSPFNNYYTNLINFLPRIFFNNEKKIKLAVHRNCSNSFRKFIKDICFNMNLEIQFVYLDDQYYNFVNSQCPQFFNLRTSVAILNTLNNKIQIKKGKKIYIQRKNCNFRNLINEYDLIKKLEKLDFIIVDLTNTDVIKQIKFFASAEIIMGPTGSGLTNIVFCNKGTKIFEISPSYNFEYENNFKIRYSQIAKYLDLDYQRIEADSIDIDLNKYKNISSLQSIDTKILKESNYYKNLILDLNKFDKLTQLLQ